MGGVHCGMRARADASLHCIHPVASALSRGPVEALTSQSGKDSDGVSWARGPGFLKRREEAMQDGIQNRLKRKRPYSVTSQVLLK